MKQFEITLIHKLNDKIQSIDKIEADDLVQLLMQFTLAILNVQRTIHKDEIIKIRQNDDIPF